ncbi:MAG: GAF domain-containing protein [Chlorobi bacterium]|nr:GAF domain-containing protein [Chlorobiota bacterium]
MVLKKSSPYIKIGIILLSIVFVGMLHFKLSNTYTNKLTNTSNTVKLLEQSKIQLQKINILSNLLEYESTKYHKEILSAADKIDYSFSILLNGGKLSDNKNEFNYAKPNNKETQKLKELTKAWNKYHTSLIQFSKNSNDDVVFNLLNTNYKNLISKQNSAILFYTKEHKDLKLKLFLINLISTLFYILISIILFIFIKNNFIKPIKHIELAIGNISEGKEIKNSNTHEYYKAIMLSLSKMEAKTRERYNFANQLVKNNLDVEFKSYNKNNLLEYSLVQLKNKLKENIEENAKRIEEEKQRQWFAEGQAKFNDILRASSDSINLLASTSLKNIVKFFDAAQGGFFILKEEENKEKYLELTAAFAYDRMKALNKTIPLGEGLVGMCAIEGNTIWVNNVPDDYMDIESGLGEAPPTNILIVPLKKDNNILGVIEIASFNEFKQNEVLFIENIAENIASTLETTKITDKTAMLLEESQKQSLELAMRDAEMSEKIAELRELQKQTSKSETEMTSLILAVDKVLFKIELSLSGKISFANPLLTKKLNYDITGNKLSEITKEKDSSKIADILKKVENNETVQTELNLLTSDKKTIKTLAIFSPVKNEKGRISKVLILANDISSIAELSKENSLLTTEIEKQQLHLLNINEEKENNIKEYKEEAEKTKNKLKKLIEKEALIKEKHQKGVDKKYQDWLASFG